MKAQIERELQVLLGKPLLGSSRAADMEMFAFGERHHAAGTDGRTRVKGDFALHVQCPWRIVRRGRILVGSGDVYSPRDDRPTTGEFRWDEPGSNWRDQQLEKFFRERASNPLVVEAVTADRVGGLRIRLRGSCSLELFPDDSLDEVGHSERWRILQPGINVPHVVVTGRGIEHEG